MFLGPYLSLLILFNLLHPQASLQATNRVISPLPTIFHTPTPSPTMTPTPTSTPTPYPTATRVPTATPTPTPVRQINAGNYEQFFDQYSSQYGVDKNLLKKIAQCESGINPDSRTDLYGGMFQFATQTWISTRSDMGLDTNPDLRFSAEEAIKTAAFKISNGGANAWKNCL